MRRNTAAVLPHALQLRHSCPDNVASPFAVAAVTLPLVAPGKTCQASPTSLARPTLQSTSRRRTLQSLQRVTIAGASCTEHEKRAS
jgi:hypothetical protein